MFNIVISGRRLISALAVSSLILLSVVYFFAYFKTAVPTTKYEIKNTDKERRIFIESFGYTLKEDKPQVEKITVPSEFNDTYMEFEKLQNKMGLSLEKFKGETLKKYTYFLSDGKRYAELYIYEKYVVAGAVINPDLKEGYIKALVE